MKNLFKLNVNLDSKRIAITLDYSVQDSAYVYRYIDMSDDSNSIVCVYNSYDSAYCRFLKSCFIWFS